MKIEPSGLEGGAFDGLKYTVAEWAAPARSIIIAVNTRALAGFVAGLKGDGCGKEREPPDWRFTDSGLNAGFAFREMGSGVLMGRGSVEEDFTIG